MFPQKLCKQKRKWSEIFRVLKGKIPTNLGFCKLLNYHSNLRKIKDFLRYTKTEFFASNILRHVKKRFLERRKMI